MPILWQSIELKHGALNSSFTLISLQLLKDMDRVCQQPGLTMKISRDWRDIWVPKIIECGEASGSSRSLPPLLEIVNSDNPGMKMLLLCNILVHAVHIMTEHASWFLMYGLPSAQFAIFPIYSKYEDITLVHWHVCSLSYADNLCLAALCVRDSRSKAGYSGIMNFVAVI